MSRRKKAEPTNFPYSPTDVIGLEDIYTVINFVQVSRKDCSFLASSRDSVIMENLFLDCEIKFKKLPNGSSIKYSLTPPPVREIPEEAFIIGEEFEDEIIEDGQCF